jgi:hypothetical protein
MTAPTLGTAEDSGVLHSPTVLLVETLVVVIPHSFSLLLDKYRERRWDMTKWDRWLAQLDQVFGFQDRKKSSVKKMRQGFDEKTNEHVFIIEYRVMRGEHSDPRRRKEASIERRANQKEVNSLLQDINDRATLGFPQS